MTNRKSTVENGWFKLKGRSPMTLVKWIVALVAVSALAPWILVPAAGLSPMDAALGTVMAFGIGAALIWRLAAITTGSVVIEEDGVIVKTGEGRGAYKWKDIDEVSLIESPPLRPKDGTSEVEIKLSQSMRIGILGGLRSSGFGLPIGTRTVRIQVSDPERFVEVAKSFLK